MARTTYENKNADETKTFRVYFQDGNQRLFQGENIVSVINFVVYELDELAVNIVKVEEV